MKTIKSTVNEILSHYFTVNGNTITARLNFDTFSELVDQTLGDNSVEKLNNVLYDKIAEVFDLIPRKYKIEIEVYIGDFGDYTVEEAEKIVKDNVALTVYAFAMEQRRKTLTGISLLSGGVVLLIASYFLNWLDLPQIVFDIINISGTLLVWEAADVTLIERSSGFKRAKQYLKKFTNIRLLKNTDRQS